MAALTLFSDAQLWNIAHQRMDAQQQARVEAFAEAPEHRPLRAEEQSALDHLVQVAQQRHPPKE